MASEVDLARQQNRTSEANDLIPLVLGAMKVLNDFAGAVEARASAPIGEDRAANEALLLAALGLLSLRRTLWRWCVHATAEKPPTPKRSGAAPAPQTRTLR